MKFIRSIGALHIFTGAIILVLVLPSLVQHGMFMDGTQYACVARNLAQGKGSFWFPHLSDSWIKNGSTSFMEHMPLTYYLQSKFFLVFGNSIYTERIYCFCCLLLSSLLIIKIWRLLPFENNAIKRYSWLPLLLWITCGSVFWAYQNNMLEITVTVFALASVYFLLKAMYGKKRQLVFLLISGFCIFLSSLSKGIPGLFPVAGVALFCFSFNKLPITKIAAFSLILLAAPFVLYGLLYFLNEDAHESIRFHLVNRFFYRVNNDPLVENRLTILFWLLTDMLVPLILSALVLILFRLKSIKNILFTEQKKLIAFFIIIGLAGVVPLTLTHIQRAVYFVPALPFFSLALALSLVNGIEELKQKSGLGKYYQKVWYFSAGLWLAVVVACILLAGKTSRDEEVLSEVRSICAKVPAGANINSPSEVYDAWYLQFYLLRYSNITLWRNNNDTAPFYLSEKSKAPWPAENYVQMNAGLKKYELFKRHYKP